MVKVRISYDMVEGREQQAQEYLANRLAPGLAKLGFRIADVWYTIYGDAPQIIGGGELESASDAQRIFLSDDWKELVEDIDELVDNFELRVMPGEEE